MSNKRPRSGSSSGSIDKAVVDVWQRELGQLSSRSFAQRLGGSEVLSLITLSPQFLFSFVSVRMIKLFIKKISLFVGFLITCHHNGIGYSLISQLGFRIIVYIVYDIGFLNCVLLVTA